MFKVKCNFLGSPAKQLTSCQRATATAFKADRSREILRAKDALQDETTLDVLLVAKMPGAWLHPKMAIRPSPAQRLPPPVLLLHCCLVLVLRFGSFEHVI